MANRDRVLAVLDVPRCAREIADSLGMPANTAQTILGRLAAEGMTRCVTPQVHQARLYGLTTAGRLMRIEQAGHPNRMNAPVMLMDDLALYAWVQAGRYRRLVLQHLHGMMSARVLRQSIMPTYPRLSMTHVYDVLRAFRARGLAVDDPVDGWQLTPQGRRLQHAALSIHQSNGQASR